MLNRVILVGRLTRDPELRTTNSGMSVITFTLAFDDYRNRNVGDSERKGCFINCTVFGQTAENMAKYTRKGSLVGVDGRLNQRSYETKDNRKVSVIEIFCDSVQFLERRSEESVSNPNANQNEYGFQMKNDSNIEPETNNVEGIDIAEDDLPF